MKRSRFSETQIIAILKEADSGATTIREVCRKHGVSDGTYYKWKSKYGGLDASDGGMAFALATGDLNGNFTKLRNFLGSDWR